MLSKRAKYALNALMELARAADDGPLSAAAIAERAHVPGKFLEAILLDLRKAGMISTRTRHTDTHARTQSTRAAAQRVSLGSASGTLHVQCLPVSAHISCPCSHQPWTSSVFS